MTMRRVKIRTRRPQNVGRWQRLAPLWNAVLDFLQWVRWLVASRVRAVGRWMKRWLWQRNGRYLLRSLPAMVAVGMLGVLVAAVALEGPERRSSFYRGLGDTALATGDHALATLAYQRLVAANTDSPEVRYGLARAADAQGQAALVAALLDTLAPAERMGYPPGHLWQAQRLLAGTPDGPRLQAAETHLQRTLLARPDLVEAHAVLGQVYHVTQRPAEALEHLLRTLPFRPDLELVVAGLYAQKGEPNQAIAHARLARDFYRPLAEKTTDALPRLRWAEATIVAGEPATAVAILQQGLGGNQDQVFRQALAQVYLTWSDVMARERPAEWGARLELFAQALQYEPGNVAALTRLLKLAQDTGPQGAPAKAQLEQQLIQGRAPGTVHVLLGLLARTQGNLAEARQHFEQAYRLQPDLALAANNLAWVLAHSDPPDLPGALKLIDSVLERWPQEPRFRDTRGQILAKQGRWQEALTDLEAALPRMAGNTALHTTLAQAYRKVGLLDLAREHEKRAAPQQAH